MKKLKFIHLRQGKRLFEIEKNDFSLFIIDVHMKEMDGYEVAEINKGSENSKPIIFITAQAIDKYKSLKAMMSVALTILVKVMTRYFKK